MKTIKIDEIDYKLLENSVKKLSEGKVFIIGDLMLDTYLIGDSSRISPEAPVPVVKIDETKQVLGGAGNVARSIVSLGGEAHISGIVGKDYQATEMQELFEADSVQTKLYPSARHTTTVKMRVLARGQQMLRMDKEHISPLEKEDLDNFLALLELSLADYEYVIVSDYAKGVVTKELMAFLTSYINKEGKKLKIFADPKPENKELYKNLFLLTPNAKESAELSHKSMQTLDEIKIAGKSLKEELKLDNLLTTLGAQGMALFSSSDTIWHIPTKARQVFDVTGAGDTVIASLALALSANIPLLEACILSNYAAGVVVAKVGSATVNQEEMLAAIKKDFGLA